MSSERKMGEDLVVFEVSQILSTLDPQKVRVEFGDASTPICTRAQCKPPTSDHDGCKTKFRWKLRGNVVRPPHPRKVWRSVCIGEIIGNSHR